MIRVTVRNNESLEKALKRFKKDCANEGLFADIKRKNFYEKPSVQRRREQKEREKTRRKLEAKKRKRGRRR